MGALQTDKPENLHSRNTRRQTSHVLGGRGEFTSLQGWIENLSGEDVSYPGGLMPRLAPRGPCESDSRNFIGKDCQIEKLLAMKFTARMLDYY